MVFKHYLSHKPFLKTWHTIAVGTPSVRHTGEADAEDMVKALRPRIEASLLRSQSLLLGIRLDLRDLVPGDAPWN